jgi:signal transduction histidine kinase
MMGSAMREADATRLGSHLTSGQENAMSASTKVLVVDDDKFVRVTLREIFQEIGFSVFEAVNGREGLKVFANEQPDIVFTDLRMPEMDGLTLIGRLRETNPETPVVAISGAGALGEAIEAIRQGAWDYVTKPIQRVEELEIIVRRVLERARLVAENNEYSEHLEELVQKRTVELAATNRRLFTAKQALESLLSEREEMERMKDEMISAVSHEMRTPLTAMLGFTEFLLENRVDEAQLKEFLGTIHHETVRLNELIGNFLDLQRITAGQAVYNFKSLAVQPLLESAVLLFSGASQNHPITVRPAPGIPPLLGDEMRLHQALHNLLSNAVKYSPKGGEIILGAQREGDAVTLWVKDEGKGIPAELLDRIFDKFYQVDGSDRRATGGTGLGLPLVREIVKAHGGRIRVESKVGEGSTFSVSLPLAKETPEAER